MESRIQSKVSNKTLTRKTKDRAEDSPWWVFSVGNGGDVGETDWTDPADWLECWLLLTFLIIIIIKGHLLVQMKQNKNRIPHYSASS